MALMRDHFKTQANLLNGFIEKLPDNSKIVDIACGSGLTFSELLKKHKLKMYGLDGSPEMIELCVNNPGLSEILFKQLRWDSIELFFQEKGKFDLIYNLGNSISHIESLNELEILFTKIFHGLSKGGLFIFDIREWAYDTDTKSYYQNKREEIKYHPLSIARIQDKCKYKNGRQFITYTNMNEDSSDEFIVSYLMFSIEEIILILNLIGFVNIHKVENEYYNYYILSASKPK